MAKRGFKLTWKGASVKSEVNDATEEAMNDTMQEAVAIAKRLAPVDTGALRDDIDWRPAKRSGSRIVGRWGNWDIPYARFQEHGTIYIAPKYYLRRAWEQAYPGLANRIARKL